MMKYAIYLLGIAALLFGIFLYRRRKKRKVVHLECFRSVLPKGGDPFKDRIELFCIKEDP